MELDYKAIGQNIREHRRKSGLNQKELAELVNLSPQHISHIETGHTKLSLPTLGHHRTIVSAAFAQSFAPSVQL